jgi:hypothetical protein
VVLAGQEKYLAPLWAVNEQRRENNERWQEIQRELEKKAGVSAAELRRAVPLAGAGFAGLLHRSLGEKQLGRSAKWERLKTAEELRQELEEVRKQTDAARDAWEKAKGTDGEEEAKETLDRRRKAQRKLERALKVGVWTDDYSNLLSVFDPDQLGIFDW